MTGLPLSLCLVCFPQLVVIIADLCLHFLDLKGLLAFKSVTLHCMNMGVFLHVHFWDLNLSLLNQKIGDQTRGTPLMESQESAKTKT